MRAVPSVGSMANATAEFFEGLASRGHEPLLEKVRGTIRVDLDVGKRKEHWLVAVNKGDVRVSHGNGKADSTLRTSKEMFDRIASGEANAMAAMLGSSDLKLTASELQKLSNVVKRARAKDEGA